MVRLKIYRNGRREAAAIRLKIYSLNCCFLGEQQHVIYKAGVRSSQTLVEYVLRAQARQRRPRRCPTCVLSPDAVPTRLAARPPLYFLMPLRFN